MVLSVHKYSLSSPIQLRLFQEACRISCWSFFALCSLFSSITNSKVKPETSCKNLIMKTIRTGLELKWNNGTSYGKSLELNRTQTVCTARKEEKKKAHYIFFLRFLTIPLTMQHTFSFDTVVNCFMLISQEFRCLIKGICPTREEKNKHKWLRRNRRYLNARHIR